MRPPGGGRGSAGIGVSSAAIMEGTAPSVRGAPGAAGLSKAEVNRMLRRLVSIIRRAVAVDADSDRFPRGWLFHQRWGKDKDARTVGDEKIVHQTIGGRTTAWVPTRQR